MENESLFDNLSGLKEKFQHFYQHRKKITALENYSSTVKFHHKSYLALIKECMKEGFLGEEEMMFLEFMLKRYELNYLDWAHRTKWLKDILEQTRPKSKPKAVQMLIDFEKTRTPVYIPHELIARAQSNQVAQRAG